MLKAKPNEKPGSTLQILIVVNCEWFTDTKMNAKSDGGLEGSKFKMSEGDWECPSCSHINFAR